MSTPTGYTRTQIVLHWLILALIAAQFIFHDAISEAWDKVEDGLQVAFNPLVAAHVFGGLLVLVLVLWRLAIKVRRGAPPLPENEHKLLKLVALGTHHTLYLLMVLLPVSGAVAWFGGVMGAAEGHEVMKTLLLILVILHAAGGLFQHYVLKSGVLVRMLRAE